MAIYLDNAASTAPDAAVVEAMLAWLGPRHANPHSDHSHGLRAWEAVEEARENVANLVRASASQIIFTSGATESNNLALLGLFARGQSGRAIGFSQASHKSILAVAHHIRSLGSRAQALPVNREGCLQIGELEALLAGEGKSSDLVVSVPHGNNEVGTIQDLVPISKVLSEREQYLHVDAAQTAGKVEVRSDWADLISISSHKMYGPSGIGALYISDRVAASLRPILHGGGQERGLRPGSVPVFLAAGFGTAARLARLRMDADRELLQQVTSTFLSELTQRGVAFKMVGSPHRRIPGHLSVAFHGVDASDLLSRAQGQLSASTGSACSSGEISISHVLRAIGLTDDEASSVVRFSFDRLSTPRQAHDAASIVASHVHAALGCGSKV